MKKILFPILLLILITLISLFLINKDKQETITVDPVISYLEDNNYTDEQIQLILNLDEDIIDYLTNTYINNIESFLNNEQFIDDHFYRYMSINKETQLDTSSIIFIVNNDYDLIEDIIYDDMFFNIVDEKYFIKDNLSSYLAYYNLNTNLTSSEVISHIHAKVDNEFYTNITNTNIDDDILMLVNKYTSLDSSYIPSLVSINSTYGSGSLRSDAYDAFINLYNAASIEGLYIKIYSSYRSYSYQSNLYNNYVNNHGVASANTFSAKPGHSEHQTGLAIDVGNSNSGYLNFENTNEFIWMKDNAHKYGYILRYTSGNEHLTGYQYEPWHYRYIGIQAATIIYEENITFEEYYAYY